MVIYKRVQVRGIILKDDGKIKGKAEQLNVLRRRRFFALSPFL